MRRVSVDTKLSPICSGLANLITCGEGLWKLAALHSYRSRTVMNHAQLAVVPTALALLTAILMFSGKTKSFVDRGSDTAAVILIAAFLLCTLIAIAIGTSIDVCASADT